MKAERLEGWKAEGGRGAPGFANKIGSAGCRRRLKAERLKGPEAVRRFPFSLPAFQPSVQPRTAAPAQRERTGGGRFPPPSFYREKSAGAPPAASPCVCGGPTAPAPSIFGPL